MTLLLKSKYLKIYYASIGINKNLKITKGKKREGVVDRVVDSRSIIGRGLFSKETPVAPFVNMKIVIDETGQIGKIVSAFGKSGKFKATFKEDLINQDELKNKTIHMPFSKLLYDTTHKMIQDI